MTISNLAQKAEQEFKRYWSEKWYYSVELTPGEFTKGLDFKNVALTRSLLARCDVQDRQCLDISPADGLVSILMSRRKAAKVVAVDRCDFSQNIVQVNDKLSANILYYPNIKQTDLVGFLRNKGFNGFDIVINSGLLYHVYGPLNSLAYTRSLVRTGGIVIVETAVAAENTFTMHFNAAAKFYDDPTTFWFISIPCLDYMLRMLRLKPLDCEFLPVDEKKPADGPPITRLAVACRAVDEPLNDLDDRWIPQLYIATDYRDYTDWDALSENRSEFVEYTYSGKSLMTRGSSNICDLWEQYKNGAVLKPSLDQIRLALRSRE